MDFSLPPNADPATRVHALVPIVSSPHLKQILLDNNALFGPIPHEFGCNRWLYQLDCLSLSGNQISGRIPSELGNLLQLSYLNLSKNRLEGHIPTELGRLELLRTLDLSDNMLDGDIPDAVISLFQMGKLILARNRLTGSLNVQCANFCKELDLSGNELEGYIPKWLGGFMRLEIVNLSQNRLIGTIPVELGSLAELKVLNLSHNRLCGVIPESLDWVANTISSLDLSGNEFEGALPAGLQHALMKVGDWSFERDELLGQYCSSIFEVDYFDETSIIDE
ncbi:UNVERIFIED_CONTAM: hypothetical protein HDU68_002748 [Siphonaria sp. JEL0065]|nr:hypothetical protein HDU68_002748 [Siphonaria sp. JEL0065]